MVQRKKLEFYIILIAIIARVFIFGLAANDFFLIGEGQVQANLAENIVTGRGFLLSESMFHDADPRRNASLEFFRETGGFYGVLIPEQPTTFFTPGFTLFEAFIFWVASSTSLLNIIFVQLFLGIFTVFLGMKLAARFLSGWWYIAAGLFMAVNPFELYYEAIPATQALFSFLFIASLLLSFRFLEKPNTTRALQTGLIWGLAFMVRPAALPMVIWLALVVIISLKFNFRKILPIFLLLLSFVLVLVPWAIRNKRTMGRYQVLPLQGGVQMWEFNGRIFTDFFTDEAAGAQMLYGGVRETWISILNKPQLAEFPIFTDETELQRDSILYDRQIEFLKANPVLFFHLATCRFAEFIKPFPLNHYSLAHTLVGLVSFFWVGLFFVTGTILMIRMGGKGIFMSGVIAGYILMHFLTASGTPHRVALDFPMAIAALLAVRYVVNRFKIKEITQ